MNDKSSRIVSMGLIALLLFIAGFAISSAAKAPGFNECPKVVVCGSDGKTYSSPCEARDAGVTSYKAGTACNERKAAKKAEAKAASAMPSKKRESVKEDVRCSFINPPLRDSTGLPLSNQCKATIDNKRYSCQLNVSVSEKNKDLFCDIRSVKGFAQDIVWESNNCGTSKHTLDGKPKKDADKIVFTCPSANGPPAQPPVVRKFSRVSWECHDGFSVRATSPAPIAEGGWRNDE